MAGFLSNWVLCMGIRKVKEEMRRCTFFDQLSASGKWG